MAKGLVRGLSLGVKPAQGWFEAMETPCVKICLIDESNGLCSGCGRSRREIGGWTSFTHAERSRIMSELPERLHKLIKS